MLILALCLIAVASPLVAGRWPAGLLLRSWRWPILVWAALLTQIVVIDVALPEPWAEILHVGTYVAALVFAWLNRAAPGVLVVGAGALLNGVTIALNGGVLPASAAAIEAAGLDREHEFANSAVVADPVLPWLGDVFAWPAPLPLANTFSVGDVLIVAGVVIAAWAGTRRLGRSATSPEAARD
ncbi:DUF5317 family protein [Demequina sp. SYSU T00068]|uniref:DUF5317 family protein n=1 Tax=Demequina lignilytica TaxID=3051663 RepID=UPI002638E93E|nr:DUF5317 family protein [Demequina sp. SYSU T00068]MDN4490799.1 DUF5317 family protein [Demequina sp. SYSU T00068]